MSTAVAQHWVSPESRQTLADLEDHDLPRCTRTRRTIVDKLEESLRHQEHLRISEAKKTLRERRGKELTELQSRALFIEGANPEDFKGFKLTTRQRAQVKLLKKAQRASAV